MTQPTEPVINWQKRAQRLRMEHRETGELVHMLTTGEAVVKCPGRAAAQLLRLMALYRQDLAWIKHHHLI